MGALDVPPLRLSEAADVANPEGGGGHGGGGACDAIGGLQVVGRGRAEEAAEHLGSDDLAQLAALHRLAAEREGGVLVAGPEVHQLEGELVVVLERVDEACRIDLVGLLEPEHEAQEFGIAGDEGVMVAGARHEVVGEIGATVGHGLDVVEGEVELLEGEATELADHAGDELVGGDRQRMPLGPGPVVVGTDLDTEEAIGVEPQHAFSQRAQGVECVPDDQPLRGERGIQPVEGGLPSFKVVEVDPAALSAVDPGNALGGRPVGLLDVLLVEDRARELPDDVAARLELVHRLGFQVDCVVPGRYGREHVPVLRLDFHHVIEARVVAVAALREPEVGPLAAVAWNNVADGHGAVVARAPDHRLVLLFAAEARVDLGADAIEVAIDGRGVLAPADAPGTLHGTGVHPLDPDLLEEAPELRITQAAQHRLVWPSDVRGRVSREPHRRQRRGGTRLRVGVWMLPELPLARITPRCQLRLVEHRAVHQPADVAVAGGGLRGRGRRRRSRGRSDAARGGPEGTGGRRRLAAQPEHTQQGGQAQKDVARSSGHGDSECHRRARMQKE